MWAALTGERGRSRGGDIGQSAASARRPTAGTRRQHEVSADPGDAQSDWRTRHDVISQTDAAEELITLKNGVFYPQYSIRRVFARICEYLCVFC